MSFYTSLIFYRPRKPPPLRAADLASFIDAIRKKNLLTRHGSRSLSVKFGKSIDQDDKGTTWEEEITSGLSVTHEINWDIQLSNPSLQQIIDCLKGDRRRIYRAYVALGGPIAEILRPITRSGSADNKIDFCPDGLAIEVGPIELCSLSLSAPVLAGWISVDLSGAGYLFPWSVRELVERAEGSRAIRPVTDLCRTFFPVPPKPPPKRVIDARRQIGELWPYEDLAKPWNWYWGVRETG
jgi:hypothetical protein